jgi:hypothetical protein
MKKMKAMVQGLAVASQRVQAEEGEGLADGLAIRKDTLKLHEGDGKILTMDQVDGLEIRKDIPRRRGKDGKILIMGQADGLVIQKDIPRRHVRGGETQTMVKVDGLGIRKGIEGLRLKVGGKIRISQDLPLVQVVAAVAVAAAKTGKMMADLGVSSMANMNIKIKNPISDINYLLLMGF